ncbi:hypothetical protein DJ021_10460 [Phenylobacterium hankyongense]|uniref:Putative zinc-finger domain-containing protein n=1 Tax=Phenylobacterium hankyongense TaxID=1813876 RepID=A0A328AZ43_9CAUL|nr:zf-HC2 domain-containing protein [Phenylobacterium hankyongense]RAK60193.1 hypothetical protein DJ021_10460 [Phenylobacterium hankyongense]
MTHIIPLHDRHQETLRLLPWYVTGQLDEVERREVEAHLGRCAACQAELDLERQLAAEVAALPMSVEPGWARMRTDLDAQRRFRGAADHVDPPARGVGRRLAYAAVALIVAAGLMLPPSQPARYHTLGAARTSPSGNVIVAFRPETTEADLRRLLISSRARLADGPTAAGAYLLSVPPQARAAALARLRKDSEVLFAEPIDPSPPP